MKILYMFRFLGNIFTVDKNDGNKIFRHIMILNTLVFFTCVFFMLVVFVLDAFTGLVRDGFNYSDYLSFITALAAEQATISITYFKTIKDKEIKVLEIEKEIEIKRIENER